MSAIEVGASRRRGLSVLLAAILAAGTAAAQETKNEMMTYQMVFLRRGPTPGPPAAEAQKMQDDHQRYLGKLNRERVNVLYGPFLDDGDLRGFAILDVKDGDAARALFAEDPFVKAGHLAVDVKPWYGPKGWFSLPADPPAMEKLVVGFLMRGPNTAHPKAEAQEIQKGHLAYMGKLHEEGKLLAAGPFGGDSEWRGLVIYRVGSVDEAKALAAGDPAVQAGRLVIDARPWGTFKGMLK